ncbi:hypothetical protein [Maritimibacter sp. UBA3975]|uniref:hypothetical protein n=1 Tax=Maritimibacter sp. UBA3975 TaxID=1946833 RepID=UPI0025B98583|nr:hypothetical protein [Maritimibacter sp. UBA3975]|tara:strand:+ start:55317 stop:55469 length:153 start_codon:yes stop_codon:yes gene_type:complete
MTTHDALRGPARDEITRQLLQNARPEQILRLLKDIAKTGTDGFPPVQGAA